MQARKTCIPFCNVNSTSSLPQHRDPQIHAELIELVVAQCVAVRFNSLLSQCHLWCYCGQQQPVTFGATVAENRPNTSGAIVVKSILSLPVLPGRIPFRLGNNARRACLSHFCHWYLCWQVAAPYSHACHMATCLLRSCPKPACTGYATQGSVTALHSQLCKVPTSSHHQWMLWPCKAMHGCHNIVPGRACLCQVCCLRTTNLCTVGSHYLTLSELGPDACGCIIWKHWICCTSLAEASAVPL